MANTIELHLFGR